jgi:hypothetical protein
MCHQAPNLIRGKSPQREGGEVRHHRPLGVKLGTRRQDETEAHRGALVNEQTQQLQGRGIDPVQVFHDEQDRLPLRFRVQPGEEGLQRLLALPLWRQGEGWIGVGQGERQQRRQERHGLGQCHTRCDQRGFQCPQLLVWRLRVVPPQQALQMVDDRVEGALLVRG